MRDIDVARLIKHLESPNLYLQPQNFSKADFRSVEREVERCQDSFEYTARNYFFIVNKDRQDVLLDLWPSQEIILDRMHALKARGKAQRIQVIKARQIGCCLHPDTKVLTADLKWISIDEVTPGMELVSVDEHVGSAPTAGGKKLSSRQMRTAVVTGKQDFVKMSYRLTMDNGETLVATGDHRFLVGRSTDFKNVGWMTVAQMRPGYAIRSVAKPWEVGGFEDGWIGGVIDGEGCLRRKNAAGTELAITQTLDNGVFEGVRKYLDSNGYTYRTEIDYRGPGESSKFGSKPVARLLVNRSNELFRLIGQTRPKRFIEQRWWEGKLLPGKGKQKNGYKRKAWSRVLSIEPLHEQRMVDIETTTGTYIAQGFVSHNSHLVEGLGAWRMMFFPNQNGLVVADVDARSTYLFSLMLHMYENLPWWLKPLVRSKKYEEGLHFANPDTKTPGAAPGLNSKVFVSSAKDLSGVGSGFTLSFAHACLSPASLIQTSDGIMKPIVEVKPGEMVLTSRGRMMPVRGVFKSHRGTEMSTEIKPWGNPLSLVTTRDHEVLTPDGFKRASDIHAGDYVRFPVRRIIEGRSSAHLISPKMGNRYASPEQRPSVIMEIPCDYNLGWLMGLYLAEGSVSKRKLQNGTTVGGGIMFAVDKDEAEYVRQSIVNVFGEGKYAIYRHESRTAVVRMANTGLAGWVQDNFGEVDTKRIPDWVWSAGRDFCRGIVAGYLYGDGHISPRESKICATSIRIQLPIQIRNLVASLGYGWSSISYKEGGLLHGRNCKPCWIWQSVGTTNIAIRKDLGWECQIETANGNNHWHYAEDGSFVDIEVAEVRDGIEHSFYDMEVDASEHDFTTFQCCVKNSEYSLWDDAKAKEIITGQMRYALVESPDTIGVLESTAKGARRFAHKLWKANVEMGDKAEWEPVFIPYFFEKRFILPPEHGWRPEQEELDLREKARRDWLICPRCNAYRQQVPYMGTIPGVQCNRCKKGVMEELVLTDPQLCYIWDLRINAKQQGEESLMNLRENVCTTAEEAFQHFGSQVFPDACHTFVARTVGKPVAIGFFDEHSKFHGVRNHRDDAGQQRHCFQDTCQVDHSFDACDLKIWEWPAKGAQYCAGVDVAAGFGGNRDASTIVVNRIGPNGTPDHQVMSYRNNSIDPRAFAGVCYAVGKMYNDALLAIEYNLPECANYVTQYYQYPNIYRWLHLDAANNIRSNRLHWVTNEKTKKRLWMTAISFLKQRLWVVRDESIAAEMKTYIELRPGEEKVGASKDDHDDLLTAGMIALVCAHETDTFSGDSPITIPMARSADPDGDYLFTCASCSHQWSGVSNNHYSRCQSCSSAFISVKRKALELNTVKVDWDDKASADVIAKRMQAPDQWTGSVDGPNYLPYDLQ